MPDHRWIERIAKTRAERPDDIITERGWNINERFGNIRNLDLPRAIHDPTGGRSVAYRFKHVHFVCTCIHRKLFRHSGYIDILKTWGFNTISSASTAAYDIPEIIWTVDDVWLSGMAYHNGVKVWAHNTPRPVFSDGY